MKDQWDEVFAMLNELTDNMQFCMDTMAGNVNVYNVIDSSKESINKLGMLLLKIKSDKK